jgi:3D (Asp-Asp-Asp) domain-containing protein
MPKLSKIALTVALGLVMTLGLHVLTPKAEAPTDPEKEISGVLTISKNTLTALSPLPEPKVKEVLDVIVTAYSSTVFETDDDPFITAAGTYVRDGIIANNLLPFGAKVRLPEIYGDKIFVVEDRMNSRKSDYHFDVWFPDRTDALIFGVKDTYVEILEN